MSKRRKSVPQRYTTPSPSTSVNFTSSNMPATLRTQRAEHRFVFNIQQIELKYRRIDAGEDLALVVNDNIDETVYDVTMGVAAIKSINRLMHENVVCLAADEAGDAYDDVGKPDRKQQQILQRFETSFDGVRQCGLLPPPTPAVSTMLQHNRRRSDQSDTEWEKEFLKTLREARPVDAAKYYDQMLGPDESFHSDDNASTSSGETCDDPNCSECESECNDDDCLFPECAAKRQCAPAIVEEPNTQQENNVVVPYEPKKPSSIEAVATTAPGQSTMIIKHANAMQQVGIVNVNGARYACEVSKRELFGEVDNAQRRDALSIALQQGGGLDLMLRCDTNAIKARADQAEQMRTVLFNAARMARPADINAKMSAIIKGQLSAPSSLDDLIAFAVAEQRRADGATDAFDSERNIQIMRAIQRLCGQWLIGNIPLPPVVLAALEVDKITTQQTQSIQRPAIAAIEAAPSSSRPTSQNSRVQARTFYADVPSRNSAEFAREETQQNEAEKENYCPIFNNTTTRKKRKRRSTIILDSDAGSNSTPASRGARKQANNASPSTVPRSKMPRAESPSGTLSAASNYAPSDKHENKQSHRRNATSIGNIRQKLHGRSPAPSPHTKVADWSTDEHPLPLEDDFEKKARRLVASARRRNSQNKKNGYD